ncbi:MAG: hypothetical protein RL134_79 [Actinomycetota bacterium]
MNPRYLATATAAALALSMGLPVAQAGPGHAEASSQAVVRVEKVSVGAANVRGMMAHSLKDARSLNLQRAFGVPATWKVSRIAIAEADSTPTSVAGATSPTDYGKWTVGIAVVFDDGGSQPVMVSISYFWQSGVLVKRTFVDQPILEDHWRGNTTKHNLGWAMKKAIDYMADNPDTFSEVSPMYAASVRDPLTPRLDREWKWIFAVSADASVGYIIVNDVTSEVSYLPL